jgi:hypothetical protein
MEAQDARFRDRPARPLLKDPSLLVEKAYVAGEWIDADDGAPSK